MTSMFPRALAASALIASFCIGRPAVGADPLPSFAEIARNAKPAVVNIFSTRVVRGPSSGGDPMEEFFRHFFEEPPRRQEQRAQSLGSGFIVDADGYIITNAHVVQQAEQIRVKLANRDEYDAKLVGTDPKTDVAVIKIKPRGTLPAAQLGDSDALEVGDWVVAIGNPFGLAETVTAGIVSAKGRVIGAGPYDDFIQTDASINPGNSGGPLINTRGEVVGINSAIFSRSGGSVGIGFAIPINLARRVVDDLRGKGHVVRGWLGVSIQEMTPALAQSFGLEHPRGAVVVELTSGGPAEKAGIERGDVIVQYNNVEIDEGHQIPNLVAATAIGESVSVKVLRKGQERTFWVKVAEQPTERSTRREGGKSETDWGVALSDLTENQARRFDLPPDTRGALIREVTPGSPADDAELQAGDVIRQVNRQTVTSARAAQQALRKGGDRVLLLVQRGSGAAYVTLTR